MEGRLLGSGGWIPTEQRETLCVLLREDDRGLLLDAGTGLSRLVAEPELLAGVRTLDIVLTHFHLDHVCGLAYVPALPVTPTIWAPGRWLYGQASADLLAPLRTAPISPSDASELGEVRELGPGAQAVGRFEVAARAQPLHWAPTAGIRVGDDVALITDTAYEPRERRVRPRRGAPAARGLVELGESRRAGGRLHRGRGRTGRTRGGRAAPDARPHRSAARRRERAPRGRPPALPGRAARARSPAAPARSSECLARGMTAHGCGAAGRERDRRLLRMKPTIRRLADLAEDERGRLMRRSLDSIFDPELWASVRSLYEDVAAAGDGALCAALQRFDGVDAAARRPARVRRRARRRRREARARAARRARQHDRRAAQLQRARPARRRLARGDRARRDRRRALAPDRIRGDLRALRQGLLPLGHGAPRRAGRRRGRAAARRALPAAARDRPRRSRLPLHRRPARPARGLARQRPERHRSGGARDAPRSRACARSSAPAALP